MPQKSRREKERAAQRRETGQIQAPITPAPIELTAPDRTVGVVPVTSSAPAYRPARSIIGTPHSAEAEFDYSYVYSDLRRIALLACLCFGIMIVLAFVYH